MCKHSRLIHYLNRKNLFDDEWHDFKPSKFDTSAVIDLVEHIVDAIEKGETTVGIVIDLSKDFNKISYPV